MSNHIWIIFLAKSERGGGALWTWGHPKNKFGLHFFNDLQLTFSFLYYQHGNSALFNIVYKVSEFEFIQESFKTVSINRAELNVCRSRTVNTALVGTYFKRLCVCVGGGGGTMPHCWVSERNVHVCFALVRAYGGCTRSMFFLDR